VADAHGESESYSVRIQVEKVSGELKPGGRLTGRITGGKLSDGLKYSWEADFNLHLPAKSAFGGVSCGS
jgi:hypothetical protein